MIVIRDDERVAVTGATGSGKTFLVMRLLRDAPRVVVIDPTGTFDLSGYRRGELPVFARRFHIIITPGQDDDDRLADLIIEARLRRNVIIYVDEMTTVATLYPEATRQLEDIARTGREDKVNLWTAFQRPRWVPRSILTETEVFCCFTLRDADDRRTMAGYMGSEVLRPAPRYAFWYIRPGMDKARLLTYDAKHDIIKVLE